MTYLEKRANRLGSVAKSTQVDGITYHSKFEAGYADDLRMRLMAKEIKSWDRQVKLDLKVNGYHICNYYIDFVVLHLDGSREYVEIKGFETEVWKMKWKLLEAIFDKEIKEHPDDRLTVIKQQSSWGRPKPRRGKIGNARIIE